MINERVLSQSLIPFVRARTVTFTATGMKPNTRVYPFFDKRSVTAYVTPDGGSLGGNLTTDANGKVVGTFAIPNPTVAGNPRWRTGDLNFRLTSSSTNTVTAVDTVAQATYSAKGIFEVRERDIIGTRNARVEVTDVSQSVEVQRELARTSNITWIDPLAQSIISESGVGEFLTKIDIFFSTKDATIPITLQIREMDNGYPTRKVLPFGSITLNPSAVSVDATNASSATTFTFDSPVFLAPNTEYAICLISDSDNYNVWISRMGEPDVTTLASESSQVLVTSQPILGSLFKSQNSSVWTPSQYEDLKFEKKKLDATYYLHNDDDLTRVFISELKLEEFSPELQETINQLIDEYLVDYELLKYKLGQYNIRPLKEVDLKALNLDTSSGSFEDIFNHFSKDKKNKIDEMSQVHKEYSFLNRFFIFKKYSN